jgi:hypothetical protein
MAFEESQQPLPNRLLKLLVPLLGSQWVEVLPLAWRLGKRILSFQAHEGMYEVLDYETRLELADTKGEKAILHKRERVRFLQNNILAYQDQAWGDGDIFADYQCSPGVAVDRYREGHRWRILVSLRETKQSNDIQEFHIRRTIHQGFKKKVEDLQIEIDHVTRKFSISVVFPRKRFPKQVQLIERTATRTTPLEASHRLTLPDGRQQVTWSTNRPRLFEAYLIRWE